MNISEIFEREVNKVARATTLNILKGVVLATPIDTGRARGNWQTSVSKSISLPVDSLDKSGGSTINKGEAVLSATKGIKYPVYWISNNLPYIEELNRGSSQQAPAKFVESVIAKAVK